ncbi:MAG: hypothetical protein ACO3HA_02695 [Burkholderiales bacterium]
MKSHVGFCIGALAALLMLVAWLPVSAFSAETGEIRFSPGAFAATVQGEVTNAIRTWQFRARQGQGITVTLKREGGDRGTRTFTLYAYCGEESGRPLRADAIRWQGELPCTDRYTLDVAPSTDYLQQARLQRYALTLEIR